MCVEVSCFRLPEAPVSGRCRLCHRFWRSRSSVGSQLLTPRVISQQILVQLVTVGMWTDFGDTRKVIITHDKIKTCFVMCVHAILRCCIHVEL